jgi:hypothetical protein
MNRIEFGDCREIMLQDERIGRVAPPANDNRPAIGDLFDGVAA